MVFLKDTFQVLHELTVAGKIEYQALLEREADEILWKNAHKVRAFLLRLFGWIPGVDEWLHSL